MVCVALKDEIPVRPRVVRGPELDCCRSVDESDAQWKLKCETALGDETCLGEDV